MMAFAGKLIVLTEPWGGGTMPCSRAQAAPVVVDVDGVASGRPQYTTDGVTPFGSVRVVAQWRRR